MKRSEINQYIQEALDFMDNYQFQLPHWACWSPEEWKTKGSECSEIRENGIGWDLTDFGSGDFLKEGLTLVTLRNGNLQTGKKTYCEKIMFVRENQVTPIHFHWKKMEDIINRGGGTLCMRLWYADEQEGLSDKPITAQVDGVTTNIKPGEVFRLSPGQSICYEPYMYHEFWAEGEHCLVGEVSTVNDDVNDNRFLKASGRFPGIEEDVPAEYLLCNEYPKV